MKILTAIALLVLIGSTIELKTQSEIELYPKPINIIKLENTNTLQLPERNVFKTNNWNVLTDKETATPAIAFGKPIKIAGYTAINKENINAAANEFIKNNEQLLNLDHKMVKFVRANKVAGKWYVSFKQQYFNLDVLTSEIELRINSKAEVFAMRITFFNGINVTTKPTISISEAVQKSLAGLELDKMSKTKLQSKQFDNSLYILPIRKKGTISYKLVYKTEIETKTNFEKYLTYIDANNGEILMRKNLVHDLINAEFQLKTKKNHPLDTEMTFPIPNLELKVGSQTLFTDSAGKIKLNVDSAQKVSFALSGRYCRTEFQNASDNINIISTELKPGENIIVVDDSNSNKYERFAYHHLNFIRSWIMNLDPDLTCLDDQFTIIFFGNDPYKTGPNAMSDGNVISFLVYKNNTFDLAQSPSVLYHEYGHSVNTNFYQELGTEMISGACHEALADLTSSLIVDDPLIGRNVFYSDKNKYIRTLDNKNVYPDSIQGESHYDSQILSGAFWDIRKILGIEKTAELSHFARYGLPDDYDTGKAFLEWFIEVLIVDDDNGDLSDLTPNFEVINQSFNKHNIGTLLLLDYAFKSDKDKEVAQNEEKIIIESSFDVAGLGVNSIPDNIDLIYSTDNFETTNTITIPKNDGKFIAEVSSSKEPAFYQYYFQFDNPQSSSPKTFYSSKSEIYDFNFFGGMKVLGHIDFETTDGITIKNSGFSGGNYEIGQPEESVLSFYGTMKFQPAQDMTLEGNNCLVTGKKGSTTSTNDVVLNCLSSGTTEAITEDFDVSNYPMVYFSTYIFNFYASFNMNTNLEDFFKIQYSLDNSEDWTTLFTGDETDFSDEEFDIRDLETMNSVWKRIFKPINLIGLNASKIRFRFISQVSSSKNVFLDNCIDELYLFAPEFPDDVNDTKLEISKMEVYPNPLDNSSILSINSTSAYYSNIKVFSSIGELIATGKTQINSGNNSIQLSKIINNISSLSPGVYYLQLDSPENIQTINVIKR